jgi:hypothetical protein
VWYPLEAEAGPRPLLIFSHGFTSFRRNGAYLGEHLASHGFVVVAVDYPLTSMSAPGGPAVEDVVNQPGRHQFPHRYADRFQRGLRPCAVGQGRPGADRRVRDLPRRADLDAGGVSSRSGAIRASARCSPSPGRRTFSPALFFTHADLPFMMLAGDLDALVPYASNARRCWTRFPAPRW